MKLLKLPEYISLNIPFIFILLIIAVSIVISYYFYKKTVPEISNRLKYLLLILRSITFALLFLLLFSPKLSLTFVKEIMPKTAVYVDNSLSMNHDGNFEQVKQFVTLIRHKLSDKNIFWFTFNNNVKPLEQDSLTANGISTDFNAIFKNAEKNKFEKILIISDGNNTETGNFSNPPIPVITVGVGKISNGADIYIADIRYNPIARLNKEETIEVLIGNKNSKIDKKIKISLFNGKKLLATKMADDIPPGSEQSIGFNYTPHKTGLARFAVIMDTLQNEENIKNNKRTFVQRVIRKKRSIGLFVGIPDYDSKFINLLLSQMEEFDVYKFIDKITSENSSERLLDSLDVLFFSNFPGPYTRPQRLKSLNNLLIKNHPGVIIKTGENTDLIKLNEFKSCLPYTLPPKKTSPLEYNVAKSADPLMLLFKELVLNDKFWQKLPPVKVLYKITDPKQGYKSILDGMNGALKISLIGAYKKGPYRSIYINGDGYWRWYFTLSQYADIASGYQKMLSNFVYWASNAAKLKQITVDPENGKRVFSLGEKIRLNISLYDTDFEPISDGNVEVNVSWNKQTFNIDVENDSSGLYSAEFYPPGDGKYRINVSGLSGGVEIGKSTLTLEVIPMEKEFLSLSQNVSFLKTLARNSGGHYFNSFVKSDSIQNAMNMQSSSKIDEKTIALWYKPIFVIIMILLITLEWIIRRKYRLL